MASSPPRAVSIVIPVYQGERTLPGLLEEILPLTKEGGSMRVTEVILVHDGARDRSDTVMQELAQKHAFVRCVWLSRNFGQHPATLAGMSSATGEWIATIDEDGQQNPADIAKMLELALKENTKLVYAQPLNARPHGWFRNMCSACARGFFAFSVNNPGFRRYNSFRLIDGEIGRSLAAYCGNNVFLDVALSWVIGTPSHCGVMLRKGNDRASGYSMSRLIQHFFRLLITSGTRPLRFITFLGLASSLLAVLLSVYAVWVRFHAQVPVQGWTSLLIVMAGFSGMILLALGIISEYLAVAVTIAMGKPLYLTCSKPSRPKTTA